MRLRKNILSTRIVKIFFKKTVKIIYEKFFLFLIMAFLYLLINYFHSRKLPLVMHQFDSSILILKSQCDCKRNSNIVFYKFNKIRKYGVNLTDENFTHSTNFYNISSVNEIGITCDLYNVLRRGKEQKVISYSLYGKKQIYYEKLKNLTRQVKKLYPGWIMRIYYDNTIDKSIICDIECQTDEIDGQTVLIDNTDFCYAEGLDFKLPSLVNNNINHKLGVFKLNITYIHSMMWRWLPIGDSFVDVFSSRDSDSHLIQREIDAVSAWLGSDKSAHIMRDHIGHGAYMLGGLWGFYNSRNRKLANKLLNLIVDPSISTYYNPNYESPKEADQNFLSDYIYSYVKQEAIIHNSYLCKNPKLLGSYFPTKREGNCFVGNPYECDKNNLTIEKCPLECRPPNHQDWEYC